MKVLSLDVFETCLIRDVGQQEGVWQLVCRRLREVRPDMPNDLAYAELRELAERAVRQASQKEDISLAEVYLELGTSLGWTPGFCAYAADMECQVEFDVARANPRAMTLVRHEDPQEVWYLSDSVLPASAVGRMLRSAGFPDGIVATSGDEGLRKVTGSLFRSLARREGLRLRSIRHIGNDLRVDGGGSALSGVRFVHLPEANYNRYESELDSHTSRSNGLLGSCLAAASRRCRLELSESVDSGLLSVACSVAGPAIVASAAWALRRAESDGIRRLYFVARDGEILLRAAQTIQARLGIAGTVECRYLYGSRQAWHLASSAIRGWDEAVGRLLDGGPHRSVRTMLSAFQLTDDELKSVAEDVRSVSQSLDEQLGEASGEVLMRLSRSSVLHALWNEHATAAYRNTARYIRQEKLLSDGSVGVVDIGWLGKASGALVEIAEAEGASVTCYFAGGLVGDGSDSAPSGSRAYLVDARGLVTPDLNGLVHLLETFCSGTEGSTVGYEESGGIYRPKLGTPANDAALRWGLEAFQDVIVRFVETACEHVTVAGETLEVAALGAVRFPIRRNIALLWDDPSGQEARAWGSFPFETPDGTVVSLASLPTWGSIGRFLMHPFLAREEVRFGPWVSADSVLIVAPFGGESLYRRSRTTYRRLHDGLPFRGLGLLGRANSQLSTHGSQRQAPR